MKREQPVSFSNVRGRVLKGVLHYPTWGQASSAQILCHGMESNKESEKIHGDADDTVPVEEAHELYTLLPGPKKLCILQQADHRLSDPTHLEKALRESIDWIIQHLG